MTKRERQQRIARLQRWFVAAEAMERLLPDPDKYWAYAKKHPKDSVITCAMLYDLFMLATDRE